MNADTKRAASGTPRIPVHAAYKKTGDYRAEVFLHSLNSTCSKIKAERFKTRAAHFPIWLDERTGGVQRATLGKSGSDKASQLQGRTARAFSRNSLEKPWR